MQRSIARVAGVFYALNIVTIFSAIFLIRGIIVPRDANATAANLAAHATSLRIGSALEIISTACSIVVAALLYELLKSVNESASLVAAFFRLAACATAIFGYVLELAPLELPGGGVPLLVYRLRGSASRILIVFFAFHFLVIGYLILKSRILPRLVGAFVSIAGASGLIFLVLPFTSGVLLYFVPVGLIAELSLTASLLMARDSGSPA